MELRNVAGARAGTSGARPRRGAFTLIELMIVIAIIAIVAAIAIPNLLHARKSANETAAIGALKTINSSEVVFREGDKEQDGNLDYGMLTELSNVTLIDSVLGNGLKQGYGFYAAYNVTTSEFLWAAIAIPQVPGSSGDRLFVEGGDGVIYYTTSTGAFGSFSPALFQSGPLMNGLGPLPGFNPVGK